MALQAILGYYEDSMQFWRPCNCTAQGLRIRIRTEGTFVLHQFLLAGVSFDVDGHRLRGASRGPRAEGSGPRASIFSFCQAEDNSKIRLGRPVLVLCKEDKLPARRRSLPWKVLVHSNVVARTSLCCLLNHFLLTFFQLKIAGCCGFCPSAGKSLWAHIRQRTDVYNCIRLWWRALQRKQLFKPERDTEDLR